MRPGGPSGPWGANLRYLRVERECACLAVIWDAWARKVAGCAIEHVLDARLPLTAVEAPVESRRPPPSLLHQSDRAVRYASWRCRERVTEAGLRRSVPPVNADLNCTLSPTEIAHSGDSQPRGSGSGLLPARPAGTGGRGFDRDGRQARRQGPVLPHPVAVAPDVDDVAVVQEAVDQGRGHDVVAQDLPRSRSAGAAISGRP